VTVAARVRQVSGIPKGYIRADGEGVGLHELPYFVGMKEYLFVYSRLDRAARDLVEGMEGPAILRLASSAVSNHAFKYLQRAGRPFGAEIVADPWDTMAPGSTKNPFRPLIRHYATWKLKAQCREAASIAYVTEQALQRRYPARKAGVSTHYSSVDLYPEAYKDRPRTAAGFEHRPVRLVNVGNMSKILYKGQDLLLQALSELVREGLDLHLTLVGGGESRRSLERLAEQQGVAGRVTFTGKLAPGEAVRQELDRADLFVMPSRQEGLPRAMLEAMARGLPCAGSAVGGIPELLDDPFLCPPNDVPALKRTIRHALADPEEMARQSAANLERSRAYAHDLLSERRRRMYEHLKNKYAKAVGRRVVSHSGI
jgi:glycosyltransferase involved in cell wall biosynthesis